MKQDGWRLAAAGLACGLLAALLAVGGCDTNTKPGANGGAPPAREKKPKFDSRKYPIPFANRKYQEVNKKVREAWALVEVSYFVVEDKFNKAAPQDKLGINAEIEHNIFGVNATVENLFKEAIAAEPENPLNHAAYAFYLKPRKRWETETKYTPTDTEAAKEMDKAIELWPDESSFYLQKIFILTEPHQAYQWLRSGAMEELAIAQHLPEIRDCFTNAEQYYPENAYVNYYRALTVMRFTEPEDIESVRDELWREIKAGNAKKDNAFCFPQPLRPYVGDALVQVYSGVYADQKDAVYFDHWLQCGTYNMDMVDKLQEVLSAPLKWPDNKEDYFELMNFLYRVGQTQPYDRSYFTVQQVLLDDIQAKLPKDSPDALKLADASRYLSEQYRTVAQSFLEKKLLKDPTQVDVRGVSTLESTGSRQLNLKAELQPHQAAYLDKLGQLFKYDFHLPENKDKW